MTETPVSAEDGLRSARALDPASQRPGQALKTGLPALSGARASCSAAPLGVATKLAYGAGAAAFGMKDNGFSYFLLLFYNQVMGLPADWVGAVLMISLIVDGVVDPLIGHASDNLKSGWGRRHPFMYASAVPLAAAYALLWSPPPGLPQTTLLAYLLVTSIGVRMIISLYEVPSLALASELSSDYDDRTGLFAYRGFLAWCGGITAGFLAYALFLRPNASHPVGQLNPTGYAHMGAACGVSMMVVILISAIGTHRRIPHLRKAASRPPVGIRQAAAEITETLTNRSLLILLSAGFCSALATGVGASLNIYILSYFWRLTTGQISGLIIGIFLGAIAAFILTQAAASRIGKRACAIISWIGYIVTTLAPVALRLGGYFPGHESPWLLPALELTYALSTGFIICASTLMASMLADVVEESEVETGRRSEGVIFSANLFVQKCVSGVGIFGAGLLLSAISFPANATPGAVDPAILSRLVIYFLTIQGGFYLLAMALICGHRITRAKHAENLSTLAARSAD